MNFFMTLVSAVPAGAGGAPTGPSPDAIAAIAQKRSVLDYVMGQLGTLRGRVGSADKARIEEHLSSIREVERILTSTPSTTAVGCKSPDPITDTMSIADGAGKPIGMAAANARARVFLRLFATAFRCDLTRYASFAMSNGFDDRRAPEFGGGMVGHHQITHNGGHYGAGVDIEMKFVTFYAALLAYLLNELKSSPEGGGTVLDNCLIYYGSEMAEGWHTNNNMPVVLAGRAGGHVVTGRHLAFPDPTPLARLFLAILKFGGSQTAKFGLGGDTPLDGLSV